ncbi:MAG: hypothetical protein OEZ65_13585 [Gemmatimonadota bacterium]|nr:hypothetical protein [Gemmatimonadota bacterium]
MESERSARFGTVGIIVLAMAAACAAAVGEGPPAGGAPPAVPGSGSGSRVSGEADLDDPVARLQERIDRGEVFLEFDSAHGYLPALLRELAIPVSSQGLIFSRTSLQTNLITPWTPRAVYFNDDVYLGWVQESPIVEVASIDPDEGAVFYTLAQAESDRPVFRRETSTCLMCHESRSITGGVPGVMMRSVLTDRMGYVISPVHEGPTTDRTPMEGRLGGWYVTGTHGTARHAGNTMAPVLSHEVTDPERYLTAIDMHGGGNATELTGRFDTTPYLSPHSDIVALLVLAHQTRTHNLITLAQQVAREALEDQEGALRITGAEAPPGGLLPATRVRIDGAVEQLLRGMLFTREARVAGPVRGTSGFAAEFARRGPADGRGRSLRDLDLDGRLFRHPLSFLVYSDAFDALPTVVKVPFYRRLGEVLDGVDAGDDFSHLSVGDRAAIVEILTDTKPEFTAMRGG